MRVTTKDGAIYDIGGPVDDWGGRFLVTRVDVPGPRVLTTKEIHEEFGELVESPKRLTEEEGRQQLEESLQEAHDCGLNAPLPPSPNQLVARGQSSHPPAEGVQREIDAFMDRLRGSDHPIAKLRRDRGLSQEQLGRAAEVSRRGVQRAESGEAVSPDTLKKLARVLGAKPEELLP